MTKNSELVTVGCLTLITLCAILSSAYLEFHGKNSPQWLGVLAGAAAGGTLTVCQPIYKRDQNGKGMF